MNTSLKGKLSEEIVCDKITSLGFNIIARNFKINTGEIDIIAFDKNVLCFIEVRSKFNCSLGHPTESLTPKKINSIKKTASFFISKNSLFNIPLRFDFASIVYSTGEFLYFKNAF